MNIYRLSIDDPEGAGPGPLPGRSGQGARVGVGILRGCHNVSWTSQRFKNSIVQKYKGSTPIGPKLIKHIQYLFLDIVDLLGFTYV